MEKTVGSHHACIRSAFATTAATEPDTAVGTTEPLNPPDGTHDCLGHPRRLVARTRERFAAVQERLAEGKSLRAIGRELRLDHSTVRRFARADSIDELLAKAVNRQSILDAYKPYLHQRWNEVCHDIPQLHRELRNRGFPGGIQTVRRYLRPSREHGLPMAPRPVPRPRRVVRWIMTDPNRLPAGDARELKEVRAACPHLDAAARHVRDFAIMLHDRRGDLLPDRMDRVLADDLPALHSLVTGFRRDQEAVVAGLSSSWSSGQVEGQVTRIKLVKRKGYGRANLDLLRKRILLVT
ncbi:transposase [Streptomyces sp. NBC_01443]|uniref:transposase n=1 Tax=Streptomyces sp. NBC_01443 TaxID=2903868 RepID=UPI002259C0C8|nr:transposase [Streptomyces sp. NBC_01443]MCX4632585.1 transposase [Streptomyces sp. NBC_01443]